MRHRGRAFATSVALLVFSGPVWAADPIIPEPVPAAPVVSVYDWSGLYLGAQGGYGWADLEGDDEFFDEVPDRDSLDLDGGFLGGYAGYNFQWDQFVLGIEGDINKAWMDEDFFYDGDVADAELNWFGSVRGRLGYAFDRTLLFGTAGVAFANVDMFLAEFDLRDDQTFTGWTAGAGLEHAFTENWLARVEYRYYDFGEETFFGGEDPEADFDLTMHTISVGLAYKF